MYKFSKIAKHTLIYFLIFTFFLSSFLGSTIIRTTKAQGPGTTFPDAPLTCNDSVPLSTKPDRPITVSLSGTTSRISSTQATINLKLNYKVVTPSAVSTWTSSATIQEIRPQSQNWPIGAATQTSQTVTFDGTNTAVFRAQADVCWRDKDGNNFRVELIPNNLTLTNDPTSTQPPTVTQGKDTTGTDVTPTDSTPGEDRCTKACPISGWFSISGAIQDAICKMQCTIIDWESSIIGWMIGKVLYPALGLCRGTDCEITTPTP